MTAPKLELTNLQLVRLTNALGALDGIRLSPTQFEPFQFNPETSWKIAHNLSLLTDMVGIYERARKQLMVANQIPEGEMKVTADNASRVAAFVGAIEGLEDKKVPVDGLEMLSREKLNVGGDSRKAQNRIPPSVLAALSPILEA